MAAPSSRSDEGATVAAAAAPATACCDSTPLRRGRPASDMTPHVPCCRAASCQPCTAGLRSPASSIIPFLRVTFVLARCSREGMSAAKRSPSPLITYPEASCSCSALCRSPSLSTQILPLNTRCFLSSLKHKPTCFHLPFPNPSSLPVAAWLPNMPAAWNRPHVTCLSLIKQLVHGWLHPPPFFAGASDSDDPDAPRPM